jgi:hypothetical protein
MSEEHLPHWAVIKHGNKACVFFLLEPHFICKLYIYIYIYMCVCVCVCVSIYIYIHTHTFSKLSCSSTVKESDAHLSAKFAGSCISLLNYN